MNPIKRKQMEERVQRTGGGNRQAEMSIGELEASLQNFVSAEESQRQAQELDRQKTSHAAMVAEWEELSQVLETGE